MLARTITLCAGRFQLRIDELPKLHAYLVTAADQFQRMDEIPAEFGNDIQTILSATVHIDAGIHLKNLRSKDAVRVLDSLRGAETSDDRDSVYGILGLFSDGLKITPDYTKTAEAVLEEFAVRYMLASQSFGLLLCACEPDISLPSWVMDLRHTANESQQFANLLIMEYIEPAYAGGGQDASAGTRFSLSYPRPGMLAIPGLIVDSIASLDGVQFPFPLVDILPKRPYLLFRRVLLIYTELRRLANANSSWHDSPTYTAMWDRLFRIVEDTLKVPQLLRVLVELLYPLNRHLKTALHIVNTRSGRIGLVTPKARPGDHICVFTSLAAPMCGRVCDRDRRIYRLVGSAYLHGEVWSSF